MESSSVKKKNFFHHFVSMKFSYNWLKELSDTKKSPEELARFLTMRAFEVEDATPVGFFVQNIFVGQVLSIEKHPNADRLRIARVSLGDKGERTIVCGAPNIDAGQKVAVALPGAILPDGMEIRDAEIRGIHSEGMICSEKELGCGKNHDGIMVLPETAEVGISLVDFFGLSDRLLDIKILSDRAHDCLSHVGLAREITALENREFDYDYNGFVLPKTEKEKSLTISLGAGDKSLRYIGVLVRNVSVGISPKWLSDRLGVFGMRSINCIVDATNLIMLELGQPLHAFDWEKLSDKEKKSIGPRFADPGEKITLLDEKTYSLDREDIVIASDERVLALGGIMGGMDSAITSETKNILFESAHFDPISIRRTRTRLGIESDASSRFEKGISPDMTERAMTRLLELVSHIANGEVSVIVDECSGLPELKPIEFSLKDVMTLLGTDVKEEEVTRILELRECIVSMKKDHFFVTPPPYRLDIVSIADIVEEVGRGIGYDRITSQPPVFLLSSSPEEPIRKIESLLREEIVANGCVETYNYSFYSELDVKRIRLDEHRHFALKNPMNPDQAFVRLSLVPGLLKNIVFNMRRFPEIRMFECGKTYESIDGIPKETRSFSGVFFLPSEADGNLFFSVKSLVARIFKRLHVQYAFRSSLPNVPYWHPARTSEVVGSECSTLGVVGEIHPSVSKSFGIVGRVGCFEFDVDAVLKSISSDISFSAIRKYPETFRDISFFVPPRTRISDVENCMISAGAGMILGVELFDRYIDPERGRSLAFHVRLGKDDGTLSGEEADVIMTSVSKSIERDLGASVRIATM